MIHKKSRERDWSDFTTNDMYWVMVQCAIFCNCETQLSLLNLTNLVYFLGQVFNLFSCQFFHLWKGKEHLKVGFISMFFNCTNWYWSHNSLFYFPGMSSAGNTYFFIWITPISIHGQPLNILLWSLLPLKIVSPAA